jgi:hypothetical protein
MLHDRSKEQLVWTQQETTITPDNQGILLAGVHHIMLAPIEGVWLNILHILLAMHVNNACMMFMSHMHLV